MPQWPWSVYSSRQSSAISTSASPTSSRRLRNATCTTPSRASACDPRASFVAGTPNSMIAGSPRSASARTSLRRLSWVCWTTPGIDGTGSGASIPSLTNRGATRCSGVTRCSATSRRNAGVRRSRRIRRSGKATSPGYRRRVSSRAATTPAIVCGSASASTRRPRARAVSEVTGPMETIGRLSARRGRRPRRRSWSPSTTT